MGTPPCPPFRSTQLFHLAGGSGCARPGGLLDAASGRSYDSPASRGRGWQPPASPAQPPRHGPRPAALPLAAMGKLFPPLSHVLRGGAVGSVPEPWEACWSRGKCVGAVAACGKRGGRGRRIPRDTCPVPGGVPHSPAPIAPAWPPRPPGSLSPQHRWDAAAAVGLSRGSAPCHAVPCRASPSPHSWALLLTWFILAGLCHVGF